MIVCHIAWMQHYAGPSGDSPLGFKAAPGLGELLNFAPMKDHMYGWVQTGSIDLRKMGGRPDAERINGATVVWTATRPKGGRVVVGVYRNATVFAHSQDFSSPRLSTSYGTIKKYFIRTKRSDAVLIPAYNRTFEIPRGKGFPGIHPIWYASSRYKAATTFLEQLDAYISTIFRRKSSSTSSLPRASLRKPLDPARRKEIEVGAVECFNAYAMQEFGSERVRDAQKDNFGWDAEVYPRDYVDHDQSTHLDAEFLFEIKGTSSSYPIVDLSPNEYQMMKVHWQRYRIAVVTDVLGAPKLHIFRPADQSCGVWIGQNGQHLKMRQITAGRLGP